MRLALLLVPLAMRAASLTGTVVDQTGAYVPHIAVELDSVTSKLKVQTDDVGVYLSNLPAGEYNLTISVPGFSYRSVKSIGLLEGEQKRLPDITLDIGGCGLLRRDIILLPGVLFGTFSGSVDPPAKDIDVTLVCRTFSVCSSTRTDSNGHFSFEMLPPGVYGLNFHRPGFYPKNATGYEYSVNAGWESVYAPQVLEPCPNGNCDPKLRPQRPIQYCA